MIHVVVIKTTGNIDSLIKVNQIYHIYNKKGELQEIAWGLLLSKRKLEKRFQQLSLEDLNSNFRYDKK